MVLSWTVRGDNEPAESAEKRVCAVTFYGPVLLRWRPGRFPVSGIVRRVRLTLREVSRGFECLFEKGIEKIQALDV